MPTPQGGRIGRQKQRLTLFGEWVYFLCAYLDVPSPELERRMGIAHGMLSKNTRTGKGTNLPSQILVTRIWNMFTEIANEKRIPLADIEQEFFHSAKFATQSDVQRSEETLEVWRRRTHLEWAHTPDPDTPGTMPNS